MSAAGWFWLMVMCIASAASVFVLIEWEIAEKRRKKLAKIKELVRMNQPIPGWMSEYEAGLSERYVKETTTIPHNNKTMVVILRLHSGFEITGVAGCADPEKFDHDLGVQYAMEDALRKLGEFDTFLKAQNSFDRGFFGGTTAPLMDTEWHDPIEYMTKDQVANMIDEAIRRARAEESTLRTLAEKGYRVAP